VGAYGRSPVTKKKPKIERSTHQKYEQSKERKKSPEEGQGEQKKKREWEPGGAKSPGGVGDHDIGKKYFVEVMGVKQCGGGKKKNPTQKVMVEFMATSTHGK